MKELTNPKELTAYADGLKLKKGEEIYVDGEGKKFGIRTPFQAINNLHQSDVYDRVFSQYGDNKDQAMASTMELRIALNFQFKERVKFLLYNSFNNYNALIRMNIESMIGDYKKGNISYDEEAEDYCYESDNFYSLQGSYYFINFMQDNFPDYFDIEKHMNGVFNPAVIAEISNAIVLDETNTLLVRGYRKAYDAYVKMSPNICVLLCKEFAYIDDILREEIPYYLNAGMLDKKTIDSCIESMNRFK